MRPRIRTETEPLLRRRPLPVGVVAHWRSRQESNLDPEIRILRCYPLHHGIVAPLRGIKPRVLCLEDTGPAQRVRRKWRARRDSNPHYVLIRSQVDYPVADVPLVARAGVEPSLSRLKGQLSFLRRPRVVARDGIEPPSPVCKTGALPLDERGEMVGVIRFERTISRSRTARSGLTELHAVVWMVGLEPTISCFQGRRVGRYATPR